MRWWAGIEVGLRVYQRLDHVLSLCKALGLTPAPHICTKSCWPTHSMFGVHRVHQRFFFHVCLFPINTFCHPLLCTGGNSQILSQNPVVLFPFKLCAQFTTSLWTRVSVSQESMKGNPTCDDKHSSKLFLSLAGTWWKSFSLTFCYTEAKEGPRRSGQVPYFRKKVE
jgi:hypothetical protein